MKSKVCTKCNKTKSLKNFYKNKTRKDGLNIWCKTCKGASAKEWYKQNKKSVSIRNKRNYLAAYKMYPERYRGARLKRIYGMTIKDYNNMYIEQNGCCAICGRHQKEFKRRFAIDHCHSTNKNRGLLCVHCNTAIGNFNDDIDVMASAISYLKQCG